MPSLLVPRGAGISNTSGPDRAEDPVGFFATPEATRAEGCGTALPVGAAPGAFVVAVPVFVDPDLGLAVPFVTGTLVGAGPPLLPATDFADAVFAGDFFTGPLAAGAFFAGAFFAGASFTGACFAGAFFAGAFFTGAAFTEDLFAGSFFAGPLSAGTFCAGAFAAALFGGILAAVFFAGDLTAGSCEPDRFGAADFFADCDVLTGTAFLAAADDAAAFWGEGFLAGTPTFLDAADFLVVAISEHLRVCAVVGLYRFCTSGSATLVTVITGSSRLAVVADTESAKVSDLTRSSN